MGCKNCHKLRDLETRLQEACELLHSCLEWDNGGEQDYDAIVKFVNENDRDINGQAIRARLETQEETPR